MDFNIKIEPIRSNLESISLDLPFKYQQVIDELEKEDWSNQSEHNQKRSVLIDPSSNILRQIKKFLSSETVKEKIINSFYLNFPLIKEMWDGWSPEQMIQKTLWDCVFFKDEPGYFMERHLDTRLNVATGIIYLNLESDEKRTTVYYTDKHGKDELKIPNSFCQGVISINNHDTWHSACNRTCDNRYVIMIALMLLTEFHNESLDANIV